MELLDLLLHKLGYAFNDPSLLLRALTHRSLMNEAADGICDNERLEFLGDAVINLVVGHQLMQRLPDAREGELSKLRALVVSEAGLVWVAGELELGQYIRLGRGEEHTGGRKKPSILSDALEALLGAIFLDGGYQQAEAAVQRLLGPMIETAAEGNLDRDHKTRLQELAQARWHQMPRYEVLAEAGPDHAKTFTVGVFLAENELARADGLSKKAAEQRAARRALLAIEASSSSSAL